MGELQVRREFMPDIMNDSSRDGWLTELVLNNFNFWVDPTARIRYRLVLTMLDVKTLKAL